MRSGAPISRLIVSAMSGSRFSIAAITAATRARRSATLISGSNARLAADTAASTSAVLPAGTEPIGFSVEGSMTSMASFP